MDLTALAVKLLTRSPLRRRLSIEVKSSRPADIKITDLGTGQDISDLIPAEQDAKFRAAACAWPCELDYEEFVRNEQGGIMAVHTIGPCLDPKYLEGGRVQVLRRPVRAMVEAGSVKS